MPEDEYTLKVLREWVEKAEKASSEAFPPGVGGRAVLHVLRLLCLLAA
jgi:hypothetical protein